MLENYLLVTLISALASMLTFYSGFGLGTLLMPVMALFMPTTLAVGITAVVHFSNNLLKFRLLYSHVDRQIFKRFGIPAMLASLVGAWLLNKLATMSSLAPAQSLGILGLSFQIQPIKFVMGNLIVLFTVIEFLPIEKKFYFYRDHLIFGGILSGFFGGLSGHQGALRSLFLKNIFQDKKSFIATGVAIAMAVDMGRMLVYTLDFHQVINLQNELIMICFAAIVGAGTGTVLGNLFLDKVSLAFIQRFVAIGLVLLGLTLALGLI